MQKLMLVACFLGLASVSEAEPITYAFNMTVGIPSSVAYLFPDVHDGDVLRGSMTFDLAEAHVSPETYSFVGGKTWFEIEKLPMFTSDSFAFDYFIDNTFTIYRPDDIFVVIRGVVFQGVTPLTLRTDQPLSIDFKILSAPTPPSPHMGGTLSLHQVPEPATVSLIGAGLLTCAVRSRRRQLTARRTSGCP